MAEFNDIVRLAVDSYKGSVTKYSVDESQEVLRKALIEANNGSTKLDVKAIRDGKCPKLFALVETILQKVVNEGLREDEYFNQLVEYRNIAAGDQNLFEVEDASLFTVSKAAQGTQAIRRQRLPGITTAKIDTDFHVVKIYDELQRVLAGSVDWNKAIQKVGESFRQNILKEVYALWEGVNASALGGNAFFPAAGAYDEATLLNLVEHVEAAAGGKTATIIGTKAALRKIAPSIQGVESRGDLYTMGYYGSFYGAKCVAIPQRHDVGTTNFIYNDKVLTIVAGDDKPIKFITEGNDIVIPGGIYKNQDLTQDYLYGSTYGVGLILAGGNAGIGRYQFTN